MRYSSTESERICLPDETVRCHFADLPGETTLHIPPRPEGWGLAELVAAFEASTELEVSLYPVGGASASPDLHELPTVYRRHMSGFCQAAKNTRDGGGCRGHDSVCVHGEAQNWRRPFIQVCHAGVAEAVVPIVVDEQHLATAFLGQVVTPAIEAQGFATVELRVGGRVNDVAALRRGFEGLPRKTEPELLATGRLFEAAVGGLAQQLGHDALSAEIRLQNAPAVRAALDLLERPDGLSIPLSEMAERVHLSPGHFSRRFQAVVGCPYSAYVERRRLQQAQLLLHHTNLPVGEVAHRSGYSRQSYFTQRFRRQTGLTPTAFRAARQPPT